MSSYLQPRQDRNLLLGQGPIQKASGAISGNPTINCFTVSGGSAVITALWLEVTTSVTTDGGTLAVNCVPTAGNTMTLVTATDLGTTDTVAGSVVGLDRGTTAASKFLVGGRIDCWQVVTTGVVNLIGASSVNGAVTLNVMWIPLNNAARLVPS